MPHGIRLRPRARSALDAICDTFAPGGDGLPSATELRVPEALLALVGRNPRAAERRQVGQLLGLGGSPDDSVCDPGGRVWHVPGLYVCDGAAFPTASGVNPMVTIEALAHMNARGIAATLS